MCEITVTIVLMVLPSFNIFKSYKTEHIDDVTLWKRGVLKLGADLTFTFSWESEKPTGLTTKDNQQTFIPLQSTKVLRWR